MNIINKFQYGLIIPILFLLFSCEKLVEIEAPNNLITSEVIFNDQETARSAMQGIYHELFNAYFSDGGTRSVSVLAGLSADELKSLRPTDRSYMDFYENEIQPANPRNYDLWSSAYQIIYMANSVLEGISNSNEIDAEVLSEIEGEAKFIRAFSYFYLLNLYGEIPLILTRDYRENSVAFSKPVSEIYEQITTDLQGAIELLPATYRNTDRTNVNKYVAMSLMARVQLYRGNWTEAANLSTEVISKSDTYEILEDLNQVFLANSREAIWQISPAGGGGPLAHTNEGASFIFHPFITSLTHVALTEDLVIAFDEEDMRLSQWINFHSRSENYYAFKYKIRNSREEIAEYSMAIRLSELYLIRAEARLMQGDHTGAIADLNVIRNRAGLANLEDVASGVSEDEIFNYLLTERRKELFTEWGHRWLDLKRTSSINELMSQVKPDWEPTDALYPIPAEERIKNPNLNQNPGY